MLATALSIHDLLQMPPIRGKVPFCAAALVALQLALQLPFSRNFESPSEEDLAEARIAAEFLTSTSEPVYAERFWGAVAERPATGEYFVEPVHIRMLSDNHFKPVVLAGPFRERRFARVLLWENNNHYLGFIEMVMKYYRIVRIGQVKVCFGYPWLQRILYMVPDMKAVPGNPAPLKPAKPCVGPAERMDMCVAHRLTFRAYNSHLL